VAPEWRLPLILRVYPDLVQAVKAQREAAVQEFVSDRGFPAPRPLLVEPTAEPLGLPFMIMERFEGRPMLDRFKNPLAIPGTIRRLADLQVQLHGLSIDGFPSRTDVPLVDRLLTGLREEISESSTAEIRIAFAWLESHAGIGRGEETVLCHNDFHPLNILVDSEWNLCLVDWSDADLSGRHCDIGRTTALFWLAPPLARSPIERLALRASRRYLLSAYLAAYTRKFPVDADRLRYWQALHGLRAWLQVAGLRSSGRARAGAREGAAEAIPPGLVPALQKYVTERTGP
jgi:aminoglycoside phosphotransferase (APT) family kinase protein